MSRVQPDGERFGATMPVQAVVHARRLLRRWSRQPAVLIQSLILPLVLLLMYQLVFSTLLTHTSGHATIYRFVPLIMVTGALLGAIATGGSLHQERESGLLWRWWVLPGSRAAVPIGGLLAECARTFLTALLLLAAGVALGLRFHRGWLSAAEAACVPVVLVIGLATMVIGLAVLEIGKSVVELSGLLILAGAFFNTGFVPAGQYASVLRPVIRDQPMSTAVDTMRGLLDGGPVLAPLLATLAWSLGFAVVFGAVGVRSYRAAVPATPVH